MYFDGFVFRGVVFDVEAGCGADAHTGVPEQFEECVFEGGVVVEFEVIEDLFHDVGFDHVVSNVVVVGSRNDDFLVQTAFNGVDALKEFQVFFQRGHLPAHRCACQIVFVAAFDAELVKVARGNVVEVIDVLVVAPAGELFESVVMGLEGSVGEFGSA